jgi:hypothetical protein
MNVNEGINEAMAAASQGRLSQKSDDELNFLLSACRQYCASNPHSRTFDPTIVALRDEIKRRLDEKSKIEANKRHEAAMEQSNRLHQEQMDNAGKLKSSIDGLKKPHWTLTPSFAVIVLTMIFAAIAAWPVIREWFPSSQPASKAASFQPLQSNSTPASLTATQTPPTMSAVIHGTNLPVK